MAINFAAANMAGYNNPKIKIVPVTIEAGEVINPPRYTELSNICKSGEYPVIHATDNDRGLYYILPISSYLTNSTDGIDNLTFCATYSRGSSLYAVAVTFYSDNTAPFVEVYDISTGKPK